MYGKRTARKRRKTYWQEKSRNKQSEREERRERGQREGGKAGREYERNDSASGEVALS